MGSNRIKVGIFVVASAVILISAILWLMGSRFFRSVDTYYIIFDKSVSGLLPGARVEYQGVTVGKVTKMRLTQDAPPKVRIIVDLIPGTPVRKDTFASLIGSLVTNIRFVQLSGGSAESERLDDGDTIPTKEQGLEDIQDRASEISEKLLATLENVQKNLLNTKNIEAVSQLIGNLNQISADLRTTADDVSSPKNRANILAMFANASQAAAGVKRTTDTLNGLKDNVTGTLTELQKTVAIAQKVVGQLNMLATHTDMLVSESQGEMGRLLTNMADTATQLKEASSVIRDDPSRLIWGNNQKPKEIPDK